MPQSHYGRIALRSFGLALLLLLTFFGFVWAGETGGDAIFDNLKLALPMLASVTAAITGGVYGTMAITKARDRSPLVWLAVLYGLFVLFFAGGELLFPH